MRSSVFQNVSLFPTAIFFVAVAFGTSCEESSERPYETVHTCQVETVTRTGIVIYVKTLGYCELGKLILEQKDNDADGQSDKVIHYVNGPNESLQRVDYDDNANGQIDRRMRYTYDSRDNILEYKMDTCDDPSPDWASRCEWMIFAYDEHDNQLTVFDYSDYSGKANECVRYTYDEQNRIASREVDPFCTCIGNPEIICNDIFDEWDHRDTFYYDEIGNRVVVTVDYGMDDMIDFQITDQYDLNDDLISEQIDYDLDGSIDWQTDYTYDAAHNKLSEGTDADGDGVMDWAYVWTYNANNSMLTHTEFESDGAERRCRAWTYDENDNVLTKEVDDYCDGIDVIFSSFSYECP